MMKRLGYTFVLALGVGSFSMSACSDDPTSSDNDAGGESGGGTGGKTGGTTSGGSSSAAGTQNGGDAGASPAEGGAGGANEGGTGGVGEGGASNPGGSGAGNEAGAGGAGEQPLVYACGSANTFQKLCSGFKSANCTDATDCSDCVTAWTADDEGYRTTCATCNALVDAFYQCGVDAFESGNLSAGVECVDGIGADMTIDCYNMFSDADDCQGYILANDCPATWPPPQ